MNKNKDVSALRLENVVKVYGSGETAVTALKGISLNFRKNEFVSILGQSGCGKTTMLNIIGGLDRYTSGDLFIGGKSTKEYKDSDWDTYRNNSIGFIFQSYNLIPHQNVLSNVELALTLSGVSNEERKKRAKIALSKVGLKGMEHKLPNQMSGGQMQRVAIARALVNDPEIILADEPTGALDTETSIQIMEILKEVAKDRLVIMVTHNPDLAEKYSTRTIKLLDGEVIDDTMPFLGNEKDNDKEKKGKAHMKFKTALSLSLSNLRTKKGRTTLTSIAGSIGIIGIALVLALSTGFGNYVNKLQGDTLSVYPVTISSQTIDLSDMNKLFKDSGLEKFPTAQKIYQTKLLDKLTNMLKSNDLTQEDFISQLENYVKNKNDQAKLKDSWAYYIKYGYGFDMNNFIYTNIKYRLPGYLRDGGSEKLSDSMAIDTFIDFLQKYFNIGLGATGVSAEFVRSYIPTISEMPSIDLLKGQYDLLGTNAKWAEKDDEIMVVVSQTNAISDITLAVLGIKEIEQIGSYTAGNINPFHVEFDDTTEYTFDEILTKKLYYVYSDSAYTLPTEEKTLVTHNMFTEEELDTLVKDGKAKELKITGILRLKDGITSGVLQTGICYTPELVKTVVKDGEGSQVLKYMIDTKIEKVNLLNPVIDKCQNDKNITTKFIGSKLTATTEFSKVTLGCSKEKSKISLYSSNYENKESIKAFIDDTWNKSVTEENKKIYYSDTTTVLFSTLNEVVSSVSGVLIAFTAISLVVSSIMIGIITYVSVVERTKEIGVLRSLGARKRDISRIFNAETFLIGLFAGIIAILFTYLVSIPVNIIVGSMVAGIGSIMSLNPLHAVLLIAISFILTLISGIIPAKIAAKKDPVIALRSE